MRGAAIRKTIEKQLRDDWLQNHGLPLGEYDCTIGVNDILDIRVADAVFTRRSNGARVLVDTIWYDDENGQIKQIGPIELK